MIRSPFPFILSGGRGELFKSVVSVSFWCCLRFIRRGSLFALANSSRIMEALPPPFTPQISPNPHPPTSPSAPPPSYATIAEETQPLGSDPARTTRRRRHSLTSYFNDSLDEFPRRRAVLYGICALFFTTVVILVNVVISFLEKLITNEAWWSYLEDTIKCQKEPCSSFARLVRINVTDT